MEYTSGTIANSVMPAAERPRKNNGKLGASALKTIIAVEAGKYSPSLELAFRIAEAFGVPITEVFSYSKKKPE